MECMPRLISLREDIIVPENDMPENPEYEKTTKFYLQFIDKMRKIEEQEKSSENARESKPFSYDDVCYAAVEGDFVRHMSAELTVRSSHHSPCIIICL